MTTKGKANGFCFGNFPSPGVRNLSYIFNKSTLEGLLQEAQ